MNTREWLFALDQLLTVSVGLTSEDFPEYVTDEFEALFPDPRRAFLELWRRERYDLLFHLRIDPLRISLRLLVQPL